jgi:spermidine/putrescine ABC transporter ATP-binding subunit
MSASIDLIGIRKAYSGNHAVRDVSLTVEAGEFFTLLGPSGSGKTTTLMMIAGFVDPDGGDIQIGGKSIVNLPPEKRNLGVVFQNYALFPNMTAAQNVGFPLRMRHFSRVRMNEQVLAALRLVDLEAFAERRIGQLSGGQQQRVALARALVFEPPVLLMDEPLGALDRKLREHLQTEIKRVQRQLGVTVIYVTHDQDEALALSDRIAIMADGAIEQMGSVPELYERPRTMFVGQFLGESNVIEGRVKERDGELVSLELKGGINVIAAVTPTVRSGEVVQLLIRPERIFLGAVPSADANSVRGRIRTFDYLGSSARYFIDTSAGPFMVRVARAPHTTTFKPGQEVFVSWGPKDATVFE